MLKASIFVITFLVLVRAHDHLADYLDRVQNCTHEISQEIIPATTGKPTTTTTTEAAAVTTEQQSTTDADGDLCTTNDGMWRCQTFDSWESYQSWLDMENSKNSLNDGYDLYEYRGRRNAPMTSHGICEEENIAKTKPEKTTKKTETIKSDATKSIFSTTVFMIILALFK
ncbi:Oidioi.mRNA.OKI2018_I69.chr1.g1253.t1.cds [Oikopleura dioica]|uniref:Oidioi.mRNA.OKI2018_I69.chr1.g1253.t1.cds n=1 Tax=Oikopleura dioica TaxID=34765 RepID=A0ABN7SRM0_OIKDI|nr:Oidioi.mRNA.OKI2018_I69.chr1.g1253.t1.cds [Oikopleura dioica]